MLHRGRWVVERAWPSPVTARAGEPFDPGIGRPMKGCIAWPDRGPSGSTPAEKRSRAWARLRSADRCCIPLRIVDDEAVKRRVPSVVSAMTPFPYAIDAGESVDAARAMMREHEIHHLPVLREGVLDGIISSQDIDVTYDVLAKQTVAVQLTVGAIYTRDPYVVEVDARLDEVAEEIARRRIDSALITKHGKLAGILTNTDVCYALVALLRESAGGPGDDVA